MLPSAGDDSVVVTNACPNIVVYVLAGGDGGEGVHHEHGSRGCARIKEQLKIRSKDRAGAQGRESRINYVLDLYDLDLRAFDFIFPFPRGLGVRMRTLGKGKTTSSIEGREHGHNPGRTRSGAPTASGAQVSRSREWS